MDLEWSHREAWTCGRPSRTIEVRRRRRRELEVFAATWYDVASRNPLRIARPNRVSMLANNPRGVSRSSLPWLAVVLVLSACDVAESDRAAPGGTAGLVGDGSDVEEV